MLQSLAGFAFPLETEQIRSAMPRPSSRIAIRAKTERPGCKRLIRKENRTRLGAAREMLYCAFTRLQQVNYCSAHRTSLDD